MRAVYLFKNEPDISAIRKELDRTYGQDNAFFGTVNGHPVSFVRSRIESPSAGFSVTYQIDGVIDGTIAGYFNNVLEGMGGKVSPQPQKLPSDGMDMERLEKNAGTANWRKEERLARDILDGGAKVTDVTESPDEFNEIPIPYVMRSKL
ncbi:MAG: hypothetical protein V1887_00180 [Candidatus Aenigmatarchaeota archaeon]